MGMQASVGLSAVTPTSILDAIKEFKNLGRAKFLRKYGFSRSSKFYLLHANRIYDTKALIGAAYSYATGRKIRHDQFGGGPQTNRLIEKARLSDGKIFEDNLGELSNLSGEFDCLPRAGTPLRKLGFSKWISLEKYKSFHTIEFPGVYVILAQDSEPSDSVSIINQHVVYIGETVDQNLNKRLYQFTRSIAGKPGHSGGQTLRTEGLHERRLWLSIRSFPLGYGLDDAFARSFRSSQIRSLERTLLYEYVRANQGYPKGNSK